MSSRRTIPITTQDLAAILERMKTGSATDEDARRVAELILFLINPAMARLEEYSFTLGDGEMEELEHMTNMVARFIGRPAPYDEKTAAFTGFPHRGDEEEGR